MKRNSVRFCIIGGDSAIGVALRKHLRVEGVEAIWSSRRAPLEPGAFHLDLRKPDIGARLHEHDVVVVMAAVSTLAECRADPATARMINVEAPEQLASQSRDAGAFTLFLSTDRVFEGSMIASAPNTSVSPRCFYGGLKAEAEHRLSSLDPGIAIVRLGKVIGQHLKLFENWRGDLQAGKEIRAFRDLVMSPIAIDKVACGLARLGRARAGGIRHLSGGTEIDYWQAARHVASRLRANGDLVIEASAAAAGIPDEERPQHAFLLPGDIASITGFESGDARTELDIGLGFASWTAPPAPVLREATR